MDPPPSISWCSIFLGLTFADHHPILFPYPYRVVWWSYFFFQNNHVLLLVLNLFIFVPNVGVSLFSFGSCITVFHLILSLKLTSSPYIHAGLFNYSIFSFYLYLVTKSCPDTYHACRKFIFIFVIDFSYLFNSMYISFWYYLYWDACSWFLYLCMNPI